MNKVTSVEEYIAQFEPKTRAILRQIRQLIKENAPEVTEKISYGMPGYMLHGPLVYFGGFKNHIGFYPTPTATASFGKELEKYVHGKGSIQFPLSEPIPFDLIKKIVEFRVKENTA